MKALTIPPFDPPSLRQRVFAWSKLTPARQRRKEQRYPVTHVPRSARLSQAVTQG